MLGITRGSILFFFWPPQLPWVLSIGRATTWDLPHGTHRSSLSLLGAHKVLQNTKQGGLRLENGALFWKPWVKQILCPLLFLLRSEESRVFCFGWARLLQGPFGRMEEWCTAHKGLAWISPTCDHPMCKKQLASRAGFKFTLQTQHIHAYTVTDWARCNIAFICLTNTAYLVESCWILHTRQYKRYIKTVNKI